MDGFFCFDAIASSLPLQSRRPALSKFIQQIFSRSIYAPYFANQSHAIDDCESKHSIKWKIQPLKNLVFKFNMTLPLTLAVMIQPRLHREWIIGDQALGTVDIGLHVFVSFRFCSWMEWIAADHHNCRAVDSELELDLHSEHHHWFPHAGITYWRQGSRKGKCPAGAGIQVHQLLWRV